MEENKGAMRQGPGAERKEPTIEEALEYIHIMEQRYHEMENRLKEVVQDNALMKLNFLMEVIKIDGKFSDSFIATAVAEIERTIYPEPEKEESKK
jgi:hypothetical protein